MSFLIVVDKANSKNAVSTDLLKEKLCPYNSNLSFEKVNSQITLFHTNLVSRHEQSNAVEFRLPFNHHQEPGMAWGIIGIQAEILRIQTDSLGQLPLYIFEDDQRIAISCEQKSFSAIRDLKLNFNFLNTEYQSLGSDLEKLVRLEPGSGIRLNLNSSSYEIDRKIPVWKMIKPNDRLTIADSKQILVQALKTTAMNYSSKITASLLSGGIDSSLATALIPSITDTYNLKTRWGDEEKHSQFTANFLNKRTHTIDFKDDSVEKLFSRVTHANETSEGLSTEIFIQLSALIQAAASNHKFVLTGYGADYLFGGMLKHKMFMQLTGCRDTETLIDRAVWAKEFSPFYAWQMGVIPVHFYWNEEFMKRVLQIPLDFQFFENFDKYLLRTVACEQKWLVPEISFRPKLALTNGTQMNKIFSDFLQLPDEFSYDKKTRKSQEKLSEILIS